MNHDHGDGPASCGAALLPPAVDVGMYVVDDQGRIVQVNARAEELLAWSAADLIGRDAHDFLHRGPGGERLPSARCPMMKAFLGGRPAQGDHTWFKRGDGSLLRLAWLVAPCRTEDGIGGALVIFHESIGEPPPEQADAVALSELDRLALLAETTTTLTSTLNAEEAVQRLIRLLVPRLADWAVVDLITEENDVRRTLVVHHADGALVRRDDLEGPMPPVPEESPMPLSRALRGVAASLAGPEYYRGTPDSGIAVTQRELFDATGMHSAAIAPIRGLREVLGALTLGRADRPEAFGPADLSLLEDIARRAGLALSNARLYQRQQRVAETMQRHLLPQLPRVPGLEMTARYVPAPHASQVGGDWYDAFVLTDGATALVIGDVAGHDLDAAASMAQVRNMLRAYTWSHQEPPSAIVERLDRAILHITDAEMATMVFARAEPVAQGTWQLRWTNAGHPPPLLVTRDGQARYLEDGHGILLGSGMDLRRPDAVAPLPPLSTLVLYTDGLIESPRRSIDAGLTELRRHAAALAQRPLDTFCDLLLTRVRPPGNTDDVAVLALRTPATPSA
ncbi:MAG TPA: SpoIIE family protein phosphatase [Yinghuangia sp.]|uniref:PP2C family protein-serine/threonine phosphatase n=1 Tax=Yinghuangia sp. YIM S10712 TaxID=3436930 RepID=UPI002CB39AF1|nr:SpoIIE family protein phosphatase [Yinghuangia sp.]